MIRRPAPYDDVITLIKQRLIRYPSDTCRGATLVQQMSSYFDKCLRTTGHWMATGKAWGLASSLWEALLAWGAGGGPVEATAPTASTATY